MAGMITRLGKIKNRASIATGRASLGVLLFLLAFAVFQIAKAENKPDGAKASQPQSNPAAPPKSSALGNKTQKVSEGNADKVATGAITDIKITPEDARLTVVVATDRFLDPKEFMLENPPRLVLDFQNTENKVTFAQMPVHAASIIRVRVQQFQRVPSPIARVVLDLEEGHGAHQTDTNKDSVRLTFYKSNTKSTVRSAAPAVTPGPAESPSNLNSGSPAATAKPSRPAAPIAAGSTKPAGSAIDMDKTPRRSETPKAAASDTDVKLHSAESATRKSLSYPSAGVPNRVPRAQSELPNSASAMGPKRAETDSGAGTPAAAPTKSAAVLAEPKQAFPKAESHQIATVSAPKPVPAEKPAEAPAVAALAPASAAPPKVATPAANSGFSGQPLTLDLVDIPLVDFFRLMSDEGGINVVMDPEIKGHVSIKVVKVPWDQIFEAVLNNNGLDKQVQGTVVRIARKATLQEEAKQRESLKKANLLAADLETRIKRLNYAKANSLLKPLEDQKTVRGTVVVEERTNSLILTDLPSSINKMVQLIEALDVPQPQVEIEARIVSATRNFARDIGIQFGFVDGNLQRVTVGGANTSGTIGGTRPSDTPTTTFTAGNSSTGRGSSTSTSSGSGATSTGTSTNNQGNYNINLPAALAFGGLGVSIGNIFDTFLLDAAITAGESKGLAKLISQPKVIAQNNSQAVITQGLRFPVQIVANNTITVQFENAALTLTVTPQITYEGNIILDLKVENNTPDFSLEVNGIPSIRTSESSTRVLVSDGGTTVIGGILIDNDSTTVDQVPGLGSLPLIGNLFRRSSISRSTQEVLFFVTPRVIK